VITGVNACGNHVYACMPIQQTHGSLGTLQSSLSLTYLSKQQHILARTYNDPVLFLCGIEQPWTTPIMCAASPDARTAT
jgi:hypothetical protein